MSPEQQLVEVQIRDLPIDILTALQEHQEELMRELTLVAEQLRQEGTAGLPTRLIDVTEELTSTYGGFAAEQEARIAAAVANGDRVIDELIYRVPPGVADAARHLDALLDEADDYCRAGEHLLTLSSPPRLLALRRWFLAEFVRQVAGEHPLSWPEYDAQRGEQVVDT